MEGIWSGLKACVITSSCCSLPLAFAILSSTLGSASLIAALKIPRYKPVFIAFGTVFLAISLYFTIKKKQGSCTLSDIEKNKKTIAVAAASYISLTILTLYLVLPAISELMFS
jgi:hypothetical protein